ncbi:hypothetical protein AC46_5016 [Escherichia coli 2-222-05_S3_C3]|nr:hypothetical protein AC46_5016 [Escherichia coli 2-222-05_S3_C3]
MVNYRLISLALTPQASQNFFPGKNLSHITQCHSSTTGNGDKNIAISSM